MKIEARQKEKLFIRRLGLPISLDKEQALGEKRVNLSLVDLE